MNEWHGSESQFFFIHENAPFTVKAQQPVPFKTGISNTMRYEMNMKINILYRIEFRIIWFISFGFIHRLIWFVFKPKKSRIRHRYHIPIFDAKFFFSFDLQSILAESRTWFKWCWKSSFLMWNHSSSHPWYCIMIYNVLASVVTNFHLK